MNFSFFSFFQSSLQLVLPFMISYLLSLLLTMVKFSLIKSKLLLSVFKFFIGYFDLMMNI